MPKQTPIVAVKDICKTFDIPGRPPVHALRHVTNHVDGRAVLVEQTHIKAERCSGLLDYPLDQSLTDL